MATITGTTGNDTLTGQGEDDLILAQTGADTINGGAGNDNITTTADGGDTIDGGAGSDLWVGDFLSLATSLVFEVAPAVAETVGSDGTKVKGVERFHITGTQFGDVLTAGNGNDTLVGFVGNDVLRGGGGIDTVFGGIGDDQLSGGAGNDILSGETGNDFIEGDPGADAINGGDGLDFVLYINASAGVVASLATGGSGGDAAGDTYAEIEGLGGSQFKDTLGGWDFMEYLGGGEGNDLISGSLGADQLNGGDGIDTLTYAASNDYVQVSLEDSPSVGFNGHANGDQISEFENLIGSAFDDSLIGGAGANSLAGGTGDDFIAGRDGADLLQGGYGEDFLSGELGDDTLEGGANGDTMNGGEGIDTVSYARSVAGVQVNLATGTAKGSHAADDSFLLVENLTGSAFNDTLVGDGGANRLIGGAGVDKLAGAAGDDRLEGGDGNDVLTGGVGRDILVGGAGADVFDFNALGESPAGAGRDIVSDFAHLTDRIDLSTIDAAGGVVGDQAFQFIGSALFSGAKGELRISATGAVQGDVNGDGIADFQIQLTGGIVLSAADFVL